jgi:chromosome segregation ATPase
MNEKTGIAITGKINLDDFSQLNAFLQKNPGLSKSAVVSKAVKNFLQTGGKAAQPLPELQKQLEALQAENENLKSKLKSLEAEATAFQDITQNQAEELEKQLSEKFTTEIENLKNTVEQLQIENEKLRNQPPKSAKLSENQLLLTIPPTLQPFLTEVANRETNRTGKRITPGMILLNLFWAQVSKGPGDHLPMTFSPAEIRRRLEIVKQQNQLDK